MELIDDLTSLIIVIIIVTFLHVLLCFSDKIFHFRFMDEAIIWCNANLSSIEHFSHKYLFGGPVTVCRIINDDWTLTSEFKYTWNEIFGSSLSAKLTLLS
jgi:hypothetical protein